jgi:catechol 2,3-dioxygenase-like lactoylglutathione lyase family enzyme
MPNTSTQTHITHVGAVLVPVSNHDRSIAFYTEQLGFEKRMDVPYGDGDRWVEAAPPGVQTAVALTPPGPAASPGAVSNIGLATDDIDASHAELKSRGVDVDDEVSRFGDPVPPLFFLRDPDGNQLMVVQRD